jgi:transposase-like protein
MALAELLPAKVGSESFLDRLDVGGFDVLWVLNRRTGRSGKTVPGDLGEGTLAMPRDRDGTFEPQLVPKHQRRVPGFDEKILALYAKGMTTRDIPEIVREL